MPSALNCAAQVPGRGVEMDPVRSSLPLTAVSTPAWGCILACHLKLCPLWAHWFPLPAGKTVVTPILLDCVKMKQSNISLVAQRLTQNVGGGGARH